ncbi:MAG: glycosyltransferase [Phycisphaerae bacterium]|jgi:GT2 family glycosyltransferase
MSFASIGIVVIGRNEGERLRRCLASVAGLDATVVYVDSGSTDGSVALAKGVMAVVVDLDMTRPFTAARARNAGFRRLLERSPTVEFVQFVDGDAVLDPAWLARGIAELRAEPSLAIVCGRLREVSPKASIYNRLADLEWDAPVGDVQSCGGIFMARVEALRAVDGFRDDIVAGEEPDLCSRLLQRGFKVRRLPDPMALHDMGMTRFSQWWRRQVRSGYGGLYAFEQGAGRLVRPFSSQIHSARLWTVAWPLTVVLAAMVGMRVGGPDFAALGAVAVLSVAPLQVLRIAVRRARRGRDPAESLLYALFVMIAKAPQMCGQVRRIAERRRGIGATLIEHK